MITNCSENPNSSKQKSDESIKKTIFVIHNIHLNLNATMKKIICIETDWYFHDRKVLDKSSAEPMLKFFYDYLKKEKFDYIYRKVATKEELQYLLNQLKYKAFDDFSIVYFSFHGNNGGIKLEGEKDFLTLEELADMAGSVLKDRCVHFSSCRTLYCKKDSLDYFLSKTDPAYLSGYTKSVDYLDSALIDMVLLKQLMFRERIGFIKNVMETDYAISSKLGLTIYT